MAAVAIVRGVEYGSHPTVSAFQPIFGEVSGIAGFGRFGAHPGTVDPGVRLRAPTPGA
ncbi:hypothetical protein D3C76_1284030 [compost metagenome]